MRKNNVAALAAKGHFANFLKRDQHGIVAKHLTDSKVSF